MITLQVAKYGTVATKEKATEAGQDASATFPMAVPEWHGEWDAELVSQFAGCFPLGLGEPQAGSLWSGHDRPGDYGEALYRKLVKHFADTARSDKRVDADSPVSNTQLGAWIVAQGTEIDRAQYDAVMAAHKAEAWTTCRDAMNGTF